MEYVEYKQHLINGEIRDPEWIVHGKFFFNSYSNTYIGVIVSDKERLYYIPDTVIRLSENDIIQRCLHIHKTTPYKKHINYDKDHTTIADMDEQDIINMVTAFTQNFT